jgi:hypothetical protein
LDGAGPEQQGDDESIGALGGRRGADGRAYAVAEFELYRAIAEHRAERARRAAVALAIGWVLLIAALGALTIGAMIALSLTIGPLLAGLAVGGPMAIVGYALARYGWAGIKGLGRDEAERQAIERGGEP